MCFSCVVFTYLLTVQKLFLPVVCCCVWVVSRVSCDWRDSHGRPDRSVGVRAEWQFQDAFMYTVLPSG